MLLGLLLVSFVLVVACAVAVGELLALAERPDGSTAFDRSITTWVVAHRTSGLTTLAHVLSSVGSQAVLAPLTAVVVIMLLARRRIVLAASLITAWGGAILLYTLIKHLVHRHRPPMHLWLSDVGRTASFPSGHATQSMATFLALSLVGAIWLATPRWPGRLLALALAAGVGWSRVYQGVHWTTDVLAGWLIGAAWVAIVVWLAARANAGARAAQVDRTL
jgi:membrane-associated phospholipid phosphatase